MSRRVALIAFLVFTGTAALLAAHFGLIPLSLETPSEETAKKLQKGLETPNRLAALDDPSSSPEASTQTSTQADASSASPTETSAVSLDISRVSPDGVSVFAGHAKPNEYVTLLENGKPVGSVKADSSGEWSLVTEHRFASLEPKVSFLTGKEPPVQSQAKSDMPAAQPKSASSTDVASAEKPAKASAKSPVTAKLMKDLEDLVTEARKEAKQETESDPKPAETAERTEPEKSPQPGQTETATVKTTDGSATTSTTATEPKTSETTPREAEKKVAAVSPVQAPTATAPTSPATSASTASTSAGAETDTASSGSSSEAAKTARVAVATSTDAAAKSPTQPIPVPIMFIYNEAEFTEEGRRAVDLLLEYLSLKRHSSVSLSGHADERGSTSFNMDLSRERLDAVAKRLREGGFQGELDLIPKGESEPFQGVNRSNHSTAELFQLDRRVELRVAY
jgi:outer membrane protein OmpA-like peptidoglycan-associated protein